MISLCFLGIYHRSDCYFWLSMICANSARRLLRTPWRLNFLYKYCAVISSYFLGTYQRSDCYSWLIMICANSVRRLLRTPWLTCLRTKMVNMVSWLNPRLISQKRSSIYLQTRFQKCYMHLLRSTCGLERIRAGLVYQVYHPRKGGESGAGSSVQSQTSHILAHT